jgi:hypothetical protein
VQFRFRSLVQFRLATLLIAITLIGVWLGITVNRANRQKRAVASIAAARGNLQFAHERDAAGNRIPDAQLPGPKLLRQLIGDDYFRRVTVVGFSTEFYGERQRLGLSKVDNEGLRCFAALPDVEIVELGNNRAVTDAGLVHLRHLKKLRVLYLYRCDVTGAGCVYLADVPSLRVLDLRWNPVTPEGVKELGRIHQLTHLVLSDTPVADNDLAALAPLKNLTHLRLAGTRVTDAGLVHLEKLTGLEELSLPQSVMPEAAERLMQSLPQCQVSRPRPAE